MDLDAKDFSYSRDIYLDEFERVNKFIIYSYRQILKNEVFDPGEWENFLRNVLVKYLRQPEGKEKYSISHLFFEIEPGEIQSDGREVKFLDIKILNLSNNEIANENEYFTFECKRLDGSKSKSKAYIEEGVKRFSNSSYSSKMSLAGMIGFVQAGDIKNIIEDLNNYLKSNVEIGTMQMLEEKILEESFQYTYSSKHERLGLTDIELTHIMLDYTPIVVV